MLTITKRYPNRKPLVMGSIAFILGYATINTTLIYANAEQTQRNSAALIAEVQTVEPAKTDTKSEDNKEESAPQEGTTPQQTVTTWRTPAQQPRQQTSTTPNASQSSNTQSAQTETQPSTTPATDTPVTETPVDTTPTTPDVPIISDVIDLVTPVESDTTTSN